MQRIVSSPFSLSAHGWFPVLLAWTLLTFHNLFPALSCPRYTGNNTSNDTRDPPGNVIFHRIICLGKRLQRDEEVAIVIATSQAVRVSARLSACVQREEKWNVIFVGSKRYDGDRDCCNAGYVKYTLPGIVFNLNFLLPSNQIDFYLRPKKSWKLTDDRKSMDICFKMMFIKIGISWKQVLTFSETSLLRPEVGDYILLLWEK